MAKSKRLEVIFHNGEPDGIRTYMRHLSTIKAYVVPRQYLAEAKKIRSGAAIEITSTVTQSVLGKRSGKSVTYAALVGNLKMPDDGRDKVRMPGMMSQ